MVDVIEITRDPPPVVEVVYPTGPQGPQGPQGIPGVPGDTIVAAASRVLANMLAAGDAQPAWRVLGSGQMEWGAGGAATPDLSLYRYAAGVLRLGTATQKARLGIFGGTTGDVVVQTWVATETQSRWYVRADGLMSWGDGTTAPDTTLQRWGAAGLLAIGTQTQKGRLRAYASGASDNAFETLITTDTQFRWYVRADGTMAWGPGNAATDISLTREAQGILTFAGTNSDGTTFAVKAQRATTVGGYCGLLVDRSATGPSNCLVFSTAGVRQWATGMDVTSTDYVTVFDFALGDVHRWAYGKASSVIGPGVGTPRADSRLTLYSPGTTGEPLAANSNMLYLSHQITGGASPIKYAFRVNNGGDTAVLTATGQLRLGSGVDPAEDLDVTNNASFNKTIRFGNTLAAYYTAQPNPSIQGTGSGGAYPFSLAGNLVLASRPNVGRDILLVNSASAVPALVMAVSSSGNYGGGVGVVYLANATTIPSTNPAGGGILYAEAGALKYRGPSGAVTTIGAA